MTHPDPTPPATTEDYRSHFEFCPIGAYRSSPEGVQLRANPALVRLNGYASEAEMLASVHDIGSECYVEPARRAQFRAQLERDGFVSGFVSEIYRHRTRERIWISEHAHVVRDAQGRTLFYEGTVEEVTHKVEAQAALLRSEEQLRQVTSHVPGVVYRVLLRPDGTRRFDFVSPAVRQLFGVEPEAVLADGELLMGLLHPEDSAPVLLEADGRVQRGEPLAAEGRVVLADGTVKWMQLTSSAVASPEPGSLRVGVIIDISARKRAEAALHEADELWKLAFESTGDGAWDWYVQTGVEYLSQRCAELYGFAPGELADRAEELDRRTHPDDLAQMQIDRDAHFAGRTPSYTNEHRVRCKDGRWKWILSRGMIIGRDGDGRPLRMIGTHTDISERKQADALRLERDRAESANRATTQFLSRVSHELRTPLNAILGFAQLLELDTGAGAGASPCRAAPSGLLPPGGTTPQASWGPKHHAWVKQILASGRHLLGLVNDVLDLSSAQTGQVGFDCASVDLRGVVDEAWDMLAATSASAGIEYLPALPATLPPVHADRKRLKQVVANLLSNAIKYNREGGRIRLEAVAADATVELLVHDTGRGMSADQLGLIFQPFERLGAQRSGVDGTGLGLALSRQLVEAMGGSIRVASVAGSGSTFVVRLPRAEPEVSGART